MFCPCAYDYTHKNANRQRKRKRTLSKCCCFPSNIVRNKPFFSPSFAAGVTEACSSVVVSSSLFSSINALLYFQDIVATRRVSCHNTHFSVLRTPEMLHTFAFRAIDASPHWFVATRISPCSALPKCCIHSHSGLSPYLLMYVCSVNRQSTLPASSHVPCDYRTIATSSSRGMCKLHPYAR